MKLFFKETAVEDVLAAQQYIDRRLGNPAAAQRLTERIYSAAALLCDNPYMGAPLSGKYDMDTDLRYLVVAKQLLFYRVREDRIVVTRVIDGRQDYMAILFG